MRLYFFRHGIAENADAETPDFKRMLTAEGVRQTHHAAQILTAMEVNPARLYTSPLIRARQTAGIIGQTFGAAVQVRREVGSGFSIQAVEALTRDLSDDDAIMFVGHEPDFSLTIASLIGGRVVMKRGGCARVDVVSYHPLLGSLIWLIPPKLFDKLR